MLTSLQTQANVLGWGGVTKRLSDQDKYTFVSKTSCPSQRTKWKCRELFFSKKNFIWKKLL